MNGSFQTEGSIDVPELWRELEELEEGTLGEPHREELAALLGRSPAARRVYLEYFQQSAVLRMEAAKLHERGLLPFVGSASQTRRVFQRSVLAAAALVALAAVIAALVMVARPAPARMSAVVAAETRWSVDGVKHGSSGDPVQVEEGSILQVFSGTLRLKTDEGDLLVVQGPATVMFPKLYKPQLRKGWLWIDTAESGEPFEVDAGRLLIRDIGTRFGVRVPEKGPTEVHLVDGEVEVMAEGSGKRLFNLKEEKKAFALSAKGEKEELSMAPDPFPSLADLLERQPDYRTMVLSQSPVGYWMLDEAEDVNLANTIPGSSPASRGQAVRGGELGLGAEGGFRGLPKGNRSLYMEGDSQRSAVVGLDGLHGVKQREGAVSFWIRRSAEPIRKDEILWLAGRGDDNSRAPFQSILHTRLDTSGRVVFEMTDSNTNIELSSPGRIDDGRWHHVAASWGPTAVDLFVDGILVGHDAKSRNSAEGNLRGRFVRFGKPSLDQREMFDAFTGWVDEIVLWDRPLSAVEVSCQFEAAVGQDKE